MVCQTVPILEKRAHTEAEVRTSQRQCWLAVNNSEHDAWCYVVRPQHGFFVQGAHQTSDRKAHRKSK